MDWVPIPRSSRQSCEGETETKPIMRSVACVGWGHMAMWAQASGAHAVRQARHALVWVDWVVRCVTHSEIACVVQGSAGCGWAVGV
jgi:hypothetical protein